MKYRYLFLITILITVFAFTTTAKAKQHRAPGSLPEAVTMANQELGNEYFTQTNSADKPIKWVKITGISSVLIGNSDNTYGALVYGEPHPDNDIKNEQYRYIGYTKKNEDYTNPAFPHDAWNGGYIEDRNWVKNPWKNVPGALENSYDGDSKYLPNIQKGLSVYYADISKGGDSSYWINWYQYVHILVPPTEYTWGMGRMWHNTSGSIWYISVPLAPGILTAEPDLSTNLETNSFSNVKPGDMITSTVAYKLNPDQPRPERAWLRLHHIVDGQEYPIQLQPVNGAPAPDEKGYITLQPGDVKVYGYTFTVQDTPTKILSRINPVDTKVDKNWDNNRAEAEVKIPAYDISVKIKPDKTTFTAINGDKTGVAFKIYVTRKDNIPGEIHVTGSYKGKTGTYSINTALGPGESEVMPYGFPGTPGSYTVEAEAWPVGADDIYPPDNRDRVTVTVSNQKLESDGGLHVELLDGGSIYGR